MALIDIIQKTLIRLWKKDSSWQKMLAIQGWDFSLSDLENMSPDVLAIQLKNTDIKINRQKKGFEDFTLAGKSLIHPGSPTKSLLYHIFASPNVYYKEDSEEPLNVFPTLFEIDALENYIYSLTNFDLETCIRKEGKDNVVLGMFSYEYRQAANTTHKNYADLCFSRTGVARVGTDVQKYAPDLRAFTPFLDVATKKGMRVSPARYGAFIAVKRNITQPDLQVLPYMGNDKKASDFAAKRGFWVPIHKVFPGKECFFNQLDLALSFSIYHENTKLKKICEFIQQTEGKNLEEKPYTVTEGLVELFFPSDKGNDRTASVWISPIPHSLVEEALLKTGERVTIEVPPDPNNAHFAALTLSDSSGARSAPEYVNVRKKLENNGTVINLNDFPNVSELVAHGNYQAIMHTDQTCDGWITAICPKIPLKSLPAYSLVTAPDFIPFTEQRELIEWSEAPGATKNYWALKPWALCDSRLLPNIKLKDSAFSTDKQDNTIHTLTAIVGPLGVVNDLSGSNIYPTTRRSSFLPDAAAGEFQPGWDITWDRTETGLMHLSAYGLGSPFLEDAKLCAALSTFWPAAAPDIARSYVVEGWPSICPLLDEEVGLLTQESWDGVPGPKRMIFENKNCVELPDFNHVDYVTQGLLNQFSIVKLAQIDIEEYKNRIESLWHIYRILNALNTKANWRVLSFRHILNSDAKLIEDVGVSVAKNFQTNLWAVTIYRRGKNKASSDGKKVYEEIRDENHFYVDNNTPRTIWRKKENAPWQQVEIKIDEPVL